MTKHRIFSISVASVYPHYVAKAEKKGRTKGELDQIICWLTGYSLEGLGDQLAKKTTFEDFFCPGASDESFAIIDKGHDLRCPREIHPGTDHEGNPLPGQTGR